METDSFSMLELFRLGGIIMWPLLFFSIAVISISIERAVYLFYHNLKINDIETKVSEFVITGDYDRAGEYLSNLDKKQKGAKIMLSIINQAKLDSDKTNFENRAERAAETEAMSQINSLESGFNFLTALASLAPLTGFLGTVTGMIGAFRSIAEAVEVNAQIVASGIYEALITTVFGLIIAIIAITFHSIFSHIVEKFTSNVEGACSRIISQITGNFSVQANQQVQTEEPDTKQRAKKSKS